MKVRGGRGRGGEMVRCGREQGRGAESASGQRRAENAGVGGHVDGGGFEEKKGRMRTHLL